MLIDSHYKEKHSELSDELILELVNLLNGEEAEANAVKDKFRYFVFDPLLHHLSPFRLVVVTEDNEDYIGVVNVFRVKRRK